MKQKYFISTNLFNNMFIIFYLTLIYLSFIFLRTKFKFSKLDLVLTGQ